MRRIAALGLVMALAAVGCKGKGGDEEGGGGSGGGGGNGKPAAQSGTAKIVSSLPRTGSASALTTSMVNGIKLAVEEAGGKAGPFDIVYEDWDDASAKKGDWDPEVEAANADKAVKDPSVMVYIGTYNSGAAKISMPIVNRAGLVMVSPGNTYSGLTKPGMGESNEPGIYRPSGKLGFFRVVPADDIQGAMGAQWMQKMGAKSVYVLDDRGLYGKGLADVAQQTAEDLGIKVLGREGIDPKAQEYKSVMTKIKELDPDFVYFAGTTTSNAGQVAKDMVAVGLRAKLMAPDGCFDQAFIQAAGAENLNSRTYLTFGGVPPDKLTGLGAEFLKKYVERFGVQPEAYAVYGYVAAQVAIESIKTAGALDRAKIRDAVEAYKAEDSALGPFSFDKNGDTTLTVMSGSEVKNGKFEFVTLLGGDE